MQHKQRTQYAAKYLSETQWGTAASSTAPAPSQNPTPTFEQSTHNYNIDVPTLKENIRAIRRIKRRKAPGPDNIPTQLLKTLRAENLQGIQQTLHGFVELRKHERRTNKS
jgi:hypothetical protein